MIQADGYAHASLYLNLSDLVVCFGKSGCYENLQKVDESYDGTDAQCFYDEMMNSVVP